MTVRIYVHFVSYAHRGGFGWAELTLPSPATTGEHVRALQTAVNAMPGVVQASLLGLQLLRVEELAS